MPIEIKELHIKAIISGRNGSNNMTQLKPEDILKLKKDISNEVTKKVLKTPQQKNER